MSLLDNTQGVIPVLSFTREGKLILSLAIGNLVDTEPLVGGADQTRKVAFNVLNVAQLAGQRIVDVDDNDLPVGFA
jgi:hypothetical protein